MKLSTLFFLMTIAIVPTIHAMGEGFTPEELAQRKKAKRTAPVTPNYAMPEGGPWEGLTPEEAAKRQAVLNYIRSAEQLSAPTWLLENQTIFKMHLRADAQACLPCRLAKQALLNDKITSKEKSHTVNQALVALLRHNESTPNQTACLAQQLVEVYLEKALPLQDLDVQTADKLLEIMQHQSKATITVTQEAICSMPTSVIPQLVAINNLEMAKITTLQVLRNIILSSKS